MAWPSDLVRTKNWGNEILTDSDLEGQLDLIITWVLACMNSSTGHAHEGTSNKSQKVSAASGLTIASQAQGDILYASSASAFARLGAGTAGQALTTAGAAANPAWAGMTTQGDVEYHNGTTRTRLAAGTSGKVLTTKGAAANPAYEWAGCVQAVTTITTTKTSHATALPIDTTTPAGTEGNSVSNLNTTITPKDSSNVLVVEVDVCVGSPNNNAFGITIVTDPAGTPAVVAAYQFVQGIANLGNQLHMVWKQAAGTTSAITFGIRIGNTAGSTFYVNGDGSNQAIFNGLLTSTMVIKEYKA